MKARPQLHISMLDMLSRCGIQFQRRYGYRFGCWHEEEIKPPTIALATGIAIHKAVETNLRHKMEVKELLPVEDVAQAARESFEGTWQGGMMFSDDEALNVVKTKGSAIDQTVALARLHSTELAPLIEPLAIEEKFVIEMPDYDFDLSGQKDIREASGIRDTKTARSSPPAGSAQSLQMAMYCLSEKVEQRGLPAKVSLDFLVKTKTPKVVVCEAVPHDSWIDPLYRRIEQAAKIIKSVKEGRGEFTPADPNHWCCTRKFCGWADTCPYWSGK